jgi:hypothetical protein
MLFLDSIVVAKFLHVAVATIAAAAAASDNTDNLF